jgi:hypothetical protein
MLELVSLILSEISKKLLRREDTCDGGINAQTWFLWPNNKAYCKVKVLVR